MYDFLVKFDPAVDTSEDLSKRIIYALFIKPLKEKKPRVLFINGSSGEGKSYAAIRLQEIMMEIQGINILENFENINCFTPIEYPKKLDALLHSSKLKKVNILCLHEARTLIRAKNWNSFLTQAIADVNAMSRSLKRICFMIISQFVRDVTLEIRYTLDYYITMRRDKNQTKMYISRIWKDDRDLEKPKLRKRKIFGYVVFPSGKRKKIRPNYLIIKKPDKRLTELFDELDTKAKSDIIRRKLNKLVADMEMDLAGGNQKIIDMVSFYMAKPDKLLGIGKMVGDQFRLSKDFKKMHDLSKQENEEFVKMLEQELKKRGAIEKVNIASYDKPLKEGETEAYLEENSDANLEDDTTDDDEINNEEEGGVEDDGIPKSEPTE